ncbi:MAG TPA: hypothetical protein VFM82_05085 [Flavobacteriaceae bacterium]|nr:hypothetical protein [Flavobacteriaceae bacterium]
MHPYLPHLLSDILAAHRREKPVRSGTAEFIDENEAFEKHIEEVERFISGEGYEHNFGYYCGLKPLDFPLTEQFTDEEKKQVFEAFQKMLSTWNASMEFPEKLPPPLRYELMVKILNEEFMPMDEGLIAFDFCSGFAPDCDFKGYCPCWEYWNEEGNLES